MIILAKGLSFSLASCYFLTMVMLLMLLLRLGFVNICYGYTVLSSRLRYIVILLLSGSGYTDKIYVCGERLWCTKTNPIMSDCKESS